MSLISALDKIMGEKITIITKDKKKLTLVVQVSQKGLYMKIMGGKRDFVALIPKKEVHKLIAPAFAELILEQNEIESVWKFVVKAKKGKKAKKKKKEESEEELELL